MRCPNCGYDNREGAKFCNECATPLSLRCPACRTENRPGAKFCNECAASLTRQLPGPKTSDAGLRTPDSSAERRQLTVMFCDLVGSTPLAEQLDPEDLREVVRTYQETCATVIHRFDGYIARYVGDALLVYFGYPAAHEDDAQRAARAGLGIVEAVQVMPLAQRVQLPQPLQVRIGIHTGLVVVGELGGSR